MFLREIKLKSGVYLARVKSYREESIKGVADEIIVIHDGPCHDKTMKIAAEYTRSL